MCFFMPSGLGWGTRQEHSKSAGRKGCLGEHLISGPDNKGNGRTRGFYKMPNPETTCKDPQIWASPSQQQQSTGFNRAFYSTFSFSTNALLSSQNNLTNYPLTLSPC